MTKLLRAGFSRMFRHRAFVLGTLFMSALGVFMPIMCYMDKVNNDYEVVLDGSLFAYAVFIVIVTSVFSSLFLGTEYSDGTMRNKIVVGSRRTAVYFSNLLVCTVASVLMQLAYLIPALAIGVPLLGIEMSVPSLLVHMLGTLLMSLSFISLFTMVATLCHSKALTSIICVLGVFLLMFVGLYVNSSLNEPEMYDAYSYTDATGTHEEIAKPNPNYLTGTKREVYQFIYDFLPGCQMIQLTTCSVAEPGKLMLFALLFTVLPAGAGVIIFRKSDIN